MRWLTKAYWSFVFILSFYLVILQVHAIWPFTIDDMYITLRYARFWSEGYGIVWNIYQPPVEGYSNFSFVVLAALAIKAYLNPVLVLKSAGFVGLIFIFINLYCLSRFWVSSRLALIPPVVATFYKGQIIWAVSGLETTVYEAVILGAVCFGFRAMGYHFYPKIRSDDFNVSYFVMTGILLSFAGMTRPEAPIFMILMVLWMLWDKPERTTNTFRKGFASFIVTLMFIFGSYFLWRWHYFGWFFPNPVYCKSFALEHSNQLDTNYLRLLWPFVIIALPALYFISDKRLSLLWLPSFFYLVFLYQADPIVAFDNRLFLVCFVLFLPLALLGSYVVLKVESYLIPLLWLVIGWLFIPWMSLEQYRYFTLGPLEGEGLRIDVAQWIKTHTTLHEEVVISDCGMIPYLLDNRFIDSYCLNNLALAHDPSAHRYEQFCHAIVAKKPKLIILTSLKTQDKILYTPSDACLSQVLANHEDYKLADTFATADKDSSYRYEIYRKF